jgi:hypothetical protein
MRTYDSPEEFVEELTSEKGLPPLPAPSLIQTGMVDPKESSAEGIRFAPATQASNWVMVPVSIIEKVDYLGNRPCSQGECPYVRLHLKGPGDDEGDAIFRALAGILRQPGTAPGPSAAGPTMTLPAGRYGPPVTPPLFFGMGPLLVGTRCHLLVDLGLLLHSVLPGDVFDGLEPRPIGHGRREGRDSQRWLVRTFRLRRLTMTMTTLEKAIQKPLSPTPASRSGPARTSCGRCVRNWSAPRPIAQASSKSLFSKGENQSVLRALKI